VNVSEFENLQRRFKEDLGHFLLAIQTVRVVDVAAFQRVDVAAAELARLLKGQSLVPKSLLKDLRMAIKALRAEAPYVESSSGRLVEMADRLEMTFDLILIGESHEDRIPGVPRIV
jgi:hypothetical protein